MGAEASSERGERIGCCVGSHRDKGCCVRQDKSPKTPEDGDVEPVIPHHRNRLGHQYWSTHQELLQNIRFMQDLLGESSHPPAEDDRSLKRSATDNGGVRTPAGVATTPPRTFERSSTDLERSRSGDSSLRAEDTDPEGPRPQAFLSKSRRVFNMNINGILLNGALMNNKTKEPSSSPGNAGWGDTCEFEANKALRDRRRGFAIGNSESLDSLVKQSLQESTELSHAEDYQTPSRTTKEGQSDTSDVEAFRDWRRLFQSASPRTAATLGTIADALEKGHTPHTPTTTSSDLSETSKALQAATKESTSCPTDDASLSDAGTTEASIHRKNSGVMSRLDIDMLAASQEFECLNEELGDTLRVCILGGIVMQEPDTPELIEGIANGLDSILGPDVVFLTGGMPGVQKEFAKHCGDGSRLWNLMPAGHDSRYGTGKDIDAGIGLQQSKDLYGLIGDVYVVIEGGPGVSAEAKTVAQRNAILVPVARTGGAASGMYDFPASALERPWWASEEHWSLLNRSDVLVAKTASAVCSIVRLAVALRRGSEESPRNFLDNPAGHGRGKQVGPERGRRHFTDLRSGSDLLHKQAIEAEDEEVGSWIEDVTGEARDGQPLHVWLRSGQVLFKLANELQPGLIPKDAHQIGTGNCFAHMDLLAAFARACRQLGVPEKDIFSAAALYEGRDMETFRRCLLSLARVRNR